MSRAQLLPKASGFFQYTILLASIVLLLVPLSLHSQTNKNIGDIQSLTKINDLQFPNTDRISGSQRIVVNPNDCGAAVFDATGIANRTVEVSIIEKNGIFLYTPSGKRIRVDSFTFGGSLTSFRRGAIGRFDASGNLNNMRIGATASVKNKQEPGDYTGTLTLKVEYNR